MCYIQYQYKLLTGNYILYIHIHSYIYIIYIYTFIYIYCAQRNEKWTSDRVLSIVAISADLAHLVSLNAVGSVQGWFPLLRPNPYIYIHTHNIYVYMYMYIQSQDRLWSPLCLLATVSSLWGFRRPPPPSPH